MTTEFFALFEDATAQEAIRRLQQATDAEMVFYIYAVSYTHLRAHETVLDLVCRLLLGKKTKQKKKQQKKKKTQHNRQTLQPRRS